MDQNNRKLKILYIYCHIMAAYAAHTANQNTHLLTAHTHKKPRSTQRSLPFGKNGGLESLYLMLHRHHQNDFRLKMGSDVSQFNVSCINCAGESHETMSTNHNL